MARAALLVSWGPYGAEHAQGQPEPAQRWTTKSATSRRPLSMRAADGRNGWQQEGDFLSSPPHRERLREQRAAATVAEINLEVAATLPNYGHRHAPHQPRNTDCWARAHHRARRGGCVLPRMDRIPRLDVVAGSATGHTARQQTPPAISDRVRITELALLAKAALNRTSACDPCRPHSSRRSPRRHAPPRRGSSSTDKRGRASCSDPRCRPPRPRQRRCGG